MPPEQRVAAFDNDGTLWSEQPLYFQFFFLLDQVKAAAPQHPEWRNNPAFKALMANDMAKVIANEKQLLQLIAVANSGMNVDDYDKTIRAWIASARHPKFNRPYTDLIYQPQLELLSYLRANGFKTYIVSGGTIEFMRPWWSRRTGFRPSRWSARRQRRCDYHGVEWQAGAGARARSWSSSTMARASRSGSIAILAAGRRSWPWATRTATSRCWNTPPPVTARAWPCSCMTTMPNGEFAYDRVQDRQAGQGARRREGARLDRHQHEAATGRWYTRSDSVATDSAPGRCGMMPM